MQRSLPSTFSNIKLIPKSLRDRPWLKRAGLVLIVVNEIRGVVMTAPAWVALWRYWIHH